MSSINEETAVIAAPPGYSVDFENPTRDWPIVHQIFWVYCSGTFLAFLFLLQNLYIKLYVDRKIDIEVVCLVIAWALSIIVQAILISTVVDGLTATHAWEVSIARYNHWTLLFYLSSTLYTPTTGCAKLAILCFYSKLSPAVWWTWCIRFSVFVLAGYSVAITCAMLFACNPMRRSWDVTITEGSCINRPRLYIAIAALQIFSDVGLLTIPLPMLYHLQMSLKRKAALMLMFVVGSSTVVTSVMRLVTLIPSLTDTDQTWALSKPVLWICIEGNLMSICASLPTIRRFFQAWAPNCLTSGSSEPPSFGKFSLRTFGAAGVRRKLDTLGFTKNDADKESCEGLPLNVIEAGRPATTERDHVGHIPRSTASIASSTPTQNNQ